MLRRSRRRCGVEARLSRTRCVCRTYVQVQGCSDRVLRGAGGPAELLQGPGELEVNGTCLPPVLRVHVTVLQAALCAPANKHRWAAPLLLTSLHPLACPHLHTVGAPCQGV